MITFRLRGSYSDHFWPQPDGELAPRNLKNDDVIQFDDGEYRCIDGSWKFITKPDIHLAFGHIVQVPQNILDRLQ